jgi:hypothetical protein
VDAEVFRAVPEQDHAGGYALVRLPGVTRPAMLHCTQMSAEVRADLNRGELEVGELLLVEVVSIDAQGRVRVRDLEEAPATDAA